MIAEVATFAEIIRRDTCESGNKYNGLIGARISSVFVILIWSGFGAFFPVLASRYSSIRLPSWVFFICKFFGSGVIIATAFIHLLQPANENLSNECLGEVWHMYPYAFGIMLFTLFLLFFFELLVFRLVDKKIAGTNSEGHAHSHFGDLNAYVKKDSDIDEDAFKKDKNTNDKNVTISKEQPTAYPNHFAHADTHQDREAMGTPMNDNHKEQYYRQLVAIFVLEFGVLFHSVFVGLTLAVSGKEFKTLYIVIVFHQLFEGLGLGSRIAATAWPKGRKWTPWLLALAFTLVTPIAIAIGLGVRSTYPSESARALITNGIFDSISAGILIYTGLIELMAHEFLFSNDFKGEGGFKKMMWAYFVMCVGCGLMALLGRWA